jgi:hypothetical protein
MPGPSVELLWWDGCPSTEKARRELHDALAELGLSHVEIVETEMRTDADAAAAGFAGSPTVLVDGEDVDPPGTDEPVGLSCRVYRRGDGGVAPTPDPDAVRGALRQALARKEVKR